MENSELYSEPENQNETDSLRNFVSEEVNTSDIMTSTSSDQPRNDSNDFDCYTSEVNTSDNLTSIIPQKTLDADSNNENVMCHSDSDLTETLVYEDISSGDLSDDDLEPSKSNDSLFDINEETKHVNFKEKKKFAGVTDNANNIFDQQNCPPTIHNLELDDNDDVIYIEPPEIETIVLSEDEHTSPESTTCHTSPKSTPKCIKLETIVLSDDNDHQPESSTYDEGSIFTPEDVKVERRPPQISWSTPMPKRLVNLKRKRACEARSRSLAVEQNNWRKSCLKKPHTMKQTLRKIAFSHRVKVKHIMYKPQTRSKNNEETVFMSLSPSRCPKCSRRNNDEFKVNKKVIHEKKFIPAPVKQNVKDEFCNSPDIHDPVQQPSTILSPKPKVKVNVDDKIIQERKPNKRNKQQSLPEDCLKAIHFNYDCLDQHIPEEPWPSAVINFTPNLCPIAAEETITLSSPSSQINKVSNEHDHLPMYCDPLSPITLENLPSIFEPSQDESFSRSHTSIKNDEIFNHLTFSLRSPRRNSSNLSSPRQYYDEKTRSIKFSSHFFQEPSSPETPSSQTLLTEINNTLFTETCDENDNYLPSQEINLNIINSGSSNDFDCSPLNSQKESTLPDIDTSQDQDNDISNSIRKIASPNLGAIINNQVSESLSSNEPINSTSQPSIDVTVNPSLTPPPPTPPRPADSHDCKIDLNIPGPTVGKTSVAYSELIDPSTRNRAASRSNRRTISSEYVDEEEPDRINELLTEDFYNRNPWTSRKALQFHPSEYNAMIATMGNAATEIIDNFPPWFHFIMPAIETDRKNYSIIVSGEEYVSISVAYRVPINFIHPNSTLDVCPICTKIITHKFAVINNCFKWKQAYTSSDIVKWQTEKVKACYIHWRSPSATYTTERNPWTLSRPRKRNYRPPASKNHVPAAMGPAVLPDDFI